MSRAILFSALFLAVQLVLHARAAEDTNICGLQWSYCPRDPGCATYTMSVHGVSVFDHNSTKPIKVKDVAPGSELTVTITGKTTITKVPDAGSYRIYSLQGPNVGSGPLTGAFTLDGHGAFTLSAPFIASAAVFSATDHTRFEFGVDVFQSASGSNEGQCIQVASKEYMDDAIAKSSPPFEFLCEDHGDGHFDKLKTPVEMKVQDVPAPACTPAPTKCALEWYYCPRDPGCATYTMSVGSVDVHTHDASGYQAGDNITLHIVGTTSLKTISAAGSYRIYTLSGKNGGSGVLSDAFKITSPGHFEASIPVTLQTASFSGDWFEFGLDVFQAKSGSDEGMCIEIANPAYVAAEQAKPKPAFNTLCVDNGDGHFSKQGGEDGVPEKVSPVQCITN